MLRTILDEIERAKGPVDLAALSRKHKLDVDALAAMLDHWAQRGRIQLVHEGERVYAACKLPDCHRCATDCPLKPAARSR